MKQLIIISIVVVIVQALCAATAPENQSASGGDWFLDSINTPENTTLKTPKSKKEKIVIAVVDDGVRITHRDLKDFIWKNPKETADNDIDDDGNGYVDDIHGWDVSDKNNTITPPENRLDVFYHGTHLAGIIARIAKSAYRDCAPEYIQIMPVKSLADDAEKTYIKDGYKGIEYAVKSGADIIICAWGVGHISPQESIVLEKARKKGILVVASAGNFPEEKEQYPAADDYVLAVTAINKQNKKVENSNYGGFVDLSAPGTNISAASALSDDGYKTIEGTSSAAATVAAAAAIIKLQYPSYSPQKIIACLKSSADAIDAINPRYAAKLGAGKLNIEAALENKLFNQNTKNENRLINPQGYLRFFNPAEKSASWTIKPYGEFKGLRFKPFFSKGSAGKGVIKFYAGRHSDSTLVSSYPLESLPESIYVPGTTAYVTLEPNDTDKQFELIMEYRAEPINFSTLYCRDTVKLNIEGTFEDGSGPNDYSFNSDCKWLITAPEGKVIHIKFTEFDTEAKTDFVYFFNGAGTHEKIMAIYSGPEIPPELTTWSNQVLVWFVTDGKNQGKGWKAEYRFITPD